MKPSRQDRPGTHDDAAPLRASAKVAMGRFFDRVQYFFSGMEPTLGTGGFPTLSNVLDRIDLGERYSSSVCEAENLDIERPKFPNEAGVVDLESIIIDEERWIGDPSVLIKDEPIRCRKARVWAEEDYWDKVFRAGLDCNLFTLLDKSDVARDSFGRPILNGAFGVQKS